MQQTLNLSDARFLASLAITERCCADDLEVDADQALPDIAQGHGIVEKFLALRANDRSGQETIRAIRGPVPVFSLHAGRQRGATAYDEDRDVVWLLAAGTHREGDRSDAYTHFEQLHKRDRLFPTADDYERLLRRRNAETIPLLLSRVNATYVQARSHPHEPHTVLLPSGLTMTLYVEPLAEDEMVQMEELWLALDARRLPRRWLTLIQAACTPGAEDRPWEYTEEFPSRGPDRGELRFRCWYEVHE